MLRSDLCCLILHLFSLVLPTYHADHREGYRRMQCEGKIGEMSRIALPLLKASLSHFTCQHYESCMSFAVLCCCPLSACLIAAPNALSPLHLLFSSLSLYLLYQACLLALPVRLAGREYCSQWTISTPSSWARPPLTALL